MTALVATVMINQIMVEKTVREVHLSDNRVIALSGEIEGINTRLHTMQETLRSINGRLSDALSTSEGDKTLRAYKTFAASKHVSLDGIPRDLLNSLEKEFHGDLAFAIMFVESSFKPKLKHANNYGLMQIADVHFNNYAKARPYLEECGVKSRADLLDPYKNVCVGMAHLNNLYVENNFNIRKTIKEYNASLGKKKYADKVIRTYLEIVKLKEEPNKYAARLK